MHLAVQRGSRGLPMLAELLRLRADPTDYFGVSLLGNSPDVGTMEFLVQNRADVNLRSGLSLNSPLQHCVAKAPPVQVVAKLLELRADMPDQEALAIQPFRIWVSFPGPCRVEAWS